MSDAPIHILLVDDDDVDRMAVRRALKAAELSVELTEATDGAAALQLLRARPFDCALLDYLLPDRDGLSIVREARQAGVTTPLIVMTGQGSEQVAVDLFKAGANDYLAKGRLSLDHLAQSIRSAVRVHRAEALARSVDRQLHEQVRVTDALNRIGTRLAVERDVHKLVQMVTDEATTLSGASFGAFFYNVTNAAGESYVLYTISGAPREAFERFPMPRNTEIFGPTFRGEGPVRVGDVTRDPRFGKNEPYFGMPPGHLPVRSYLAVPVVSRTREVLGGLFFGHPDRDVFQERDERLVVGIAAQAAIAIDNARLYQQLKAGEEQYRFLAESIPQMVWTARADGAVDYCNRRWQDYTGLSLEHTLGSGWTAIVHPDDLPASLRKWQWAVQTGGNYELEYRLRRASDGAYRWHLARGVPMRDGQGNIVRWFGTSTDIHDRKQTEQALQEAKEQAEAASRAKDQFLAVLSHELRTPLMPVLTTVQALELEQGVPPHLKGDIEMIRRNVELEARLIDDLLDLTRIAKGKLQLNVEPVDVHESLRNALEICRRDLEAKRMQVVFDLGAARHMVRGDPARLQQVFWNLINNAVKFTPAGGRLTFRSANRPRPADAAAGAAAPPGPDDVVVSVSDTGIGIDPEILPRIFDAFEQGETNITRKFGGLGLGLAITRALVALHQGTITATSDGKDRGTTFAVELPTLITLGSDIGVPTPLDAPPVGRREGAVADAPPTSHAAGATSEGVRILLVDDHEDTNRAMQRLLQQLGYHVRTAKSVRTALEAAAQGPFDLLISDIGLPDGSGLDLMRELLARRGATADGDGNADAAPLKGIALSGFGMEEDVRRSREAGFHDHLTKPVNFKRLETVIRELTAGATSR